MFATGSYVDVLGKIGYIIGGTYITQTKDDIDKFVYLIELEEPIIVERMTIGVIVAIPDNVEKIGLKE